MKTHMAIDPGASGGIAWRDESAGDVRAMPMPEGMTAQINAIKEIVCSNLDITATIERVGGYMPGNAGPAAATFARHCGNIEAALYCFDVPAQKPVSPQTWQKLYGFSVAKHLPPGYRDMPAETKEQRKAKDRIHSEAVRAHKNEIRESMQRKHPHLRVTLKTADALAILGWAEATSAASRPGT